MAKSIQFIAEEVRDLMQRNGKDVITFSWQEFYRFADRERLKESFRVELKAKLNDFQLLINYGNSVVLIGKDYDFSAVRF